MYSVCSDEVGWLLIRKGVYYPQARIFHLKSYKTSAVINYANYNSPLSPLLCHCQLGILYTLFHPLPYPTQFDQRKNPSWRALPCIPKLPFIGPDNQRVNRPPVEDSQGNVFQNTIKPQIFSPIPFTELLIG